MGCLGLIIVSVILLILASIFGIWGAIGVIILAFIGLSVWATISGN